MLVIMLNCVTLGMFRPCEDVKCRSERCSILEVGLAAGPGCPLPRRTLREGTGPALRLSSHQAFDDFIFAFFAVEMVIKMVALGLFGQKCYLGDTWNRLDFFIVMAGYSSTPPTAHSVKPGLARGPKHRSGPLPDGTPRPQTQGAGVPREEG